MVAQTFRGGGKRGKIGNERCAEDGDTIGRAQRCMWQVIGKSEEQNAHEGAEDDKGDRKANKGQVQPDPKQEAKDDHCRKTDSGLHNGIAFQICVDRPIFRNSVHCRAGALMELKIQLLFYHASV